MTSTSFYSESELAELGLAGVGENVRVSRYARMYGAGRISIGNNSRIDDFCVLSAGEGGISIGSYVHIAVMVTLIGSGRITIGDFVGLSGRVSVYSSTDDFSGDVMTGPMVPPDYRRFDSRPVIIGRHAIVGTGSVILPGVEIGEGAAIGALSLVKTHVDEFTVVAGVPAVRVKARSRALLETEAAMQRATRGR